MDMNPTPDTDTTTATSPSTTTATSASTTTALSMVVGLAFTDADGPAFDQEHWLVGSTAEKLITGAPCPVLVASPKPNRVERQEPAIEPACPQCVQARVASHGTTWWCARHSNDATSAHTYSYQREFPFASHDSAISPTGIDF